VIWGAWSSDDGTIRRLPRGPHTLTREQVAEDQRSRLIAATIVAVGQNGYLSTTVADVIARAGVSRKAFYEHFSNREESFLRAYDAVVSMGLAQITAAYESAGGVPQGVEAAIGLLCEQAVINPLAMRLALVEIGALGSVGIERREHHLAAYEALFRDAIGLPRGPDPISNPILRAVIGGLNGVLYARVQEHKQAQLRGLVPDLVTWATSYFPAPSEITAFDGHETTSGLGGRAPGTLSPPRLSSGRQRGLRGEQNGSHSFVVHSQRERILDAVANLSAEKGYAAITIRDIAERAAVSLDSFYGHFSGKEDAFLVAYEVGHGRSLATVERAYRAASDWRYGVRAGIAALFDFLASEPSFAHLALTDAQIATPRTAERARRGFTAYTHMLLPDLDGRMRQPPAPSVTVEAIMGGVLELCVTYTLQRRTQALTGLLRRATYFALAPFIGMEEAGRIAIEGDSATIAG
jgi:AcrR family transcriptional regulator